VYKLDSTYQKQYDAQSGRAREGKVKSKKVKGKRDKDEIISIISSF